METAAARPAFRPASVGYLGPQGTFSEEALLASAAPGAVEPTAYASIPAVVAALRGGEVDFAVVPAENSLEGSIAVTLDLLAGDGAQVEIVGEALLRVRHSLIAASETPLAAIARVVTHPQVPGQCARFLREELPHAEIVPASSTAEAVRVVVASGSGEEAAIGTRLAAEIYGGVVLRGGIEDREDNETRFLWLARVGASEPPPLAAGGGEWRTSLVFWGLGRERPGALVRCLDEFARRDINLTKIESRPQRRELGSYVFFADLGGRADERRVAEALAGVRAICDEVRVLGTYRAAVRERTGDD